MKNLNEARTHVIVREFLIPLKEYSVGAVVKTRDGEWFGHITGFSCNERYEPKDGYKLQRTLRLKVCWMNAQEESNIDFEDIKLL